MNVTEGYVLSVHNNTDKWIERNKEFFCPPVCNKMMCVNPYVELLLCVINIQNCFVAFVQF